MQQQAILGRPTMAPEEFEAMSAVYATGIQGLVNTFQQQFGTSPLNGSTSESTPGPKASRNLKRLRQDILDGTINSEEDAIKILTDLSQSVTPRERDLINEWLRKAKDQQRADRSEE